VRPGTLVTVVLLPAPGHSWAAPRSDSPMLATVMATSIDRDGTARVTIRAARTGAVTVSWGKEGTADFTLHLDVAAYPVQ
jgi:hypothetical protein